MSAFVSTTVRPAGTTGLGAFSRLLGASSHRIARYFVRRAAIARLREFDDSALKDIGLVRSQIEDAVHGHFTLADRTRAR